MITLGGNGPDSTLPRMLKSSSCSLSVILFAIVILGGCAGGPVRSAYPVHDPQVTEGLNRLRAATRPFQNLDAAVAAGYPRDVADCLVHEHHGAMGFHHVNRSYLDTRRDIKRPQILLYERLPDGKYRLNAVEFIIPYRLWPRDSVAPSIMGQRLHHEDNLKIQGQYWSQSQPLREGGGASRSSSASWRSSPPDYSSARNVKNVPDHSRQGPSPITRNPSLSAATP